MGKHKRKSDDTPIVKIALVTAILTLITQLVVLLKSLVEWLAGK